MDIKKIIAKLPTGYIDDTSGMDGNELRSEIIKAETAIREMLKEMAADEKLQGARELVKDFVAGYNEVKKAQRAKIDYLLHVLDERGELGMGLENDEDVVTKTRESAVSKSRKAKAA